MVLLMCGHTLSSSGMVGVTDGVMVTLRVGVLPDTLGVKVGVVEGVMDGVRVDEISGVPVDSDTLGLVVLVGVSLDMVGVTVTTGHTRQTKRSILRAILLFHSDG